MQLCTSDEADGAIDRVASEDVVPVLSRITFSRVVHGTVRVVETTRTH